MARLLNVSYETNSAPAENVTTTTGTATISTTTKRSGDYAGKYASGAGNAAAHHLFPISTPTLSRVYHTRSYHIFETTLPSAASTDIAKINSTSGWLMMARLTSAGKLQLWDNNFNVQVGSDSAATLVADQWYKVELRIVAKAVGATDEASLWLDNVLVASSTTINMVDAAPNGIYVGFTTAPGASKVSYVDDIAVNDDTGSDQTGRCGDENLVNLWAISDNSRATLWTGGAGGNTNLWDAVNNRPPIGTATETDLTQIEHAGGAAGSTDDYVATMTDYLTAGVPSGATITLVQGLIAHAEDNTAGAKLLSTMIVSNPAGTDTGSFSAGAGTLGTYPGNFWLHTRTPITYAPSVTLGTSPTMRVRRPETAISVASVCLMTIIVAYTPASTIDAALTSAAVATSAFAPVVDHPAALTSNAVATATLAPTVNHPAALVAAGTATASFAATVAQGAALVSAATATAAFAPVVAQAAALTATAQSTAAFAPVVASSASLTAASVLGAVFAATAEYVAALTAAATTTATLDAAVDHPAALSASASSTAAFAPLVAQDAALSVTGQATAAFSGELALTAALALAGQSTAAFDASVTSATEANLTVAATATASFAPVVEHTASLAADSTASAAFTGSRAVVADLAAAAQSSAALVATVDAASALAVSATSVVSLAAIVAHAGTLTIPIQATATFAGELAAPTMVSVAMTAAAVSTASMTAVVAHETALVAMAVSDATLTPIVGHDAAFAGAGQSAAAFAAQVLVPAVADLDARLDMDAVITARLDMDTLTATILIGPVIRAKQGVLA